MFGSSKIYAPECFEVAPEHLAVDGVLGYLWQYGDQKSGEDE